MAYLIRNTGAGILILVLGIMLFTGDGCKKFEPRGFLHFTTDSIIARSDGEYELTGTLVDIGEESIVQHGFCWSEMRAPTLGFQSSQLGPREAKGTFFSVVSGWSDNTTYYVRAYVTTAFGTSYGGEKTYTTPALEPPAVTTLPVSDITESSAKGGGHVTGDGGSPVTARGICWSTSPGPTISNSHNTDGSGTGIFTGTFTGLDCQTVYYVRAYATNAVGTGYGSEQVFTTLACPQGEPVVTTDEVSNITQTTAECGGNVTDDGGSPVTTRGLCWGTSPGPTTADMVTIDGSGTGIFTSTMTGLACHMQYYVRAYATNADGTAYGNEQVFTTSDCPPGLPTVVTITVGNISEDRAEGGGNVTDNGGNEVTTRGVCWSTSPGPTTSDNVTIDGNGTGTYTSILTGLDCQTQYYVRAYATNSVGTAYGGEEVFTTSDCPPGIATVSTSVIGSITETGAEGGGNITDDGGSEVTTRGVCWSTSPEPTTADETTIDGSGTGSFVSSITGLTCGTRYYVRAYAINSVGTAYGEEQVFMTTLCPPEKPSVSTAAIGNIGRHSATGGGTVNDDGGAMVTSRGVCWSTSSGPTIADATTDDGTGEGSYTSYISGLDCNTLYYVRAYATNSAGTTYGTEEQFTTSACGTTVEDIDGNVYETVTIGDQVWMMENLKVTRYADGTAIPLVTSGTSWESEGSSAKRAYCWYENNSGNKNLYGALYNWYAVMRGSASSDDNPSGVQGVCPAGWHVPSDAEWKQLEIHLGMSPSEADNTLHRGTDEGSKLKEAGTVNWHSPNSDATNSSGFTAIPGGQRYDDGRFGDAVKNALFWTATESNSSSAWYRGLAYDAATVRRNAPPKAKGFSIRCVENK